MSTWADLLSTALVGTSRRTFTLDTLDIEGARDIHTDSAEAAVLAAAALAAGYRRAGWTPPTWRGTPTPPSAPDDRPECTPAATQLLELLLNRGIRVEGGPDILAAHWLTAARGAGHRPPYRLTVDLLRFGTANSALRSLIRDVVGPRGTWLARHNPSWRWATTVPPQDVVERFRTGTRAERLSLLTDLRATEPDFARTLIEDTWTEEQAAVRASFLDTLHTGLSLGDEPLLERALDDRAATVRAAAAALLDRLPGSARAHRMAERARALVEKNELPDEPDELARRDGITDQREPGHGRAASWLIQILAATPLSTWDPAMILDKDREVVIGLTKAALRQRDQRWLTALARHHPGPELIAALTPAAATEILADQPKLDARFGGLLAAAPGPWPPGFSVDIVDRLREHKAESVLQLSAAALAEHLHPAALAAVETWLLTMNTDHKGARRILRGVAHALTVRATILQEFT